MIRHSIVFRSTLFSRNVSMVPKQTQILTPVKSVKQSSIRSVSKSPPNFRFELPPLMDFDGGSTGYPPYLTKFKVNFYVKPFIDNDFDPYHFLVGAKQAISLISAHMANDEIENIRPLVTEQAYEEISSNYQRYSPGQKLMLKVNIEDMLTTYLFIVRTERLGWNKYKVKILVLSDVLNNAEEVLSQTRLRSLGKQLNANDFKENLEFFKPVIDKKFLCIYEFSREYGKKGETGEWIVEKLVHFKNTDILRLKGYIK